MIAKHEKNRKPDYPDPDDCCGSGCSPCVFDTYDTNMERYEARLEQLETMLIEYSDSD